jgi:hypothetical protein
VEDAACDKRVSIGALEPAENLGTYLFSFMQVPG